LTRNTLPFIFATMQLGNAELTLVSDGAIRMDGGSMFGVVPKAIWSRRRAADRQNRVEMGLNCLLIRTSGKNVLVDTGVGTKHRQKVRTIFHMRAGELVGNLAQQSVTPEDIDLVVLTHLHFDHAGGCTRYNQQRRLEPVFPRATYLAQRQDWQEATETNERTRPAYLPEDFMPLEEAGQLELLDGDTELLPGLWVRRTGGHTAGHQMVYIGSDGEKAACLGDILPMPQHLPVHYMTAFDMYPLETLDAKRRWLERAEKGGWLLIFGHAVDHKMGRLTRSDDGRLILLPYNIDANSL
jgi:glyoxylase-like metal-dependent hydrolase (beta-lactamase superfamily II)